MLQREHFAELSTFIKLSFVIKSLFCIILSGSFTQVLLYSHYFIGHLEELFELALKIWVLIPLSSSEGFGKSVNMHRLARGFAVCIHKVWMEMKTPDKI